MSFTLRLAPNYETMPLYELALHTTDLSWRPLIEGARPELTHIEQMLNKAQELAAERQFPAHTWLYYPQRPKLFRALFYTPLETVKVILLGMDPYPTPGHACGLSFSCEQGVPASLNNIYKEIKACYPSVELTTTNGDLRPWCRQGVLLLNAALTFLTIGDKKDQQQQQSIWEQFIHRVIGEITAQRRNIAICLWGRDAQRYERYINGSHLILRSSHPSPLAANKTDEPFIGGRHFLKINEYLATHGHQEIDWSIPEQ